MDTDTFVCTALAAGGPNAMYGIMQVQKLLFLLDQEMQTLTGGPHFTWKAGAYGPISTAAGERLDALERQGQAVRLRTRGGENVHLLTQAGYAQGRATLDTLDEMGRAELEQRAQWVRAHSFTEIVSAVCARYPEMGANAVFARDDGERHPDHGSDQPPGTM